jgi:aspartyl-tRNA(Asn)/glutamyl-tRNA(Gln) amidotransferase subunit A
VTEIPLSIAEAAAALRTGRLSSAELTDAVLRQADRHDAATGVFLSRFDETARAAAAAADAELATGVDRGPLHGIPLGVKDIVATREGPTTAQSLVMDPAWFAGRDAVSVERLRTAGAVIVGKTTLMEHAVGWPDPDKPFPIPRNPWDLRRWAGGSSSGTGSGVAAGCFLGGLGTDTGGSIRIPAALCGITGHKPTFGLVPKSGCVPLGWSYDHIGPMARSAHDCALLLDVLAGGDPSDPSALTGPAPACTPALVGHAEGVRVGVFASYGTPIGPVPDGLPGVAPHPELDACLEAAVAELVAAGASRRDVAVPLYAELTDAAFIGSLCEGLAFHLRDLQRRWNDYGAPTRLSLATAALYHGADAVQAQRVRRAGARAVADVFADVDVIVLPTFPFAPPLLDVPRPVAAPYTSRPLPLPTPAFDALGLPALTVPMGFTSDGLPFGLQIVGRAGDDATVLRVGDAYQRRTDWHRREAPVTVAGPEADHVAQLHPDVPTATATADPKAVETVARMLAAAGLPASEPEVLALAAGYPTVREAADALGAVATDPADEPLTVLRLS